RERLRRGRQDEANRPARPTGREKTIKAPKRERRPLDRDIRNLSNVIEEVRRKSIDQPGRERRVARAGPIEDKQIHAHARQGKGREYEKVESKNGISGEPDNWRAKHDV